MARIWHSPISISGKPSRWLAGATAVTLLGGLLQAIPMPAQAARPATETAAADCPAERPDETSASVTARLCHKPIEVTKLTTETDQTFANPNGTYE